MLKRFYQGNLITFLLNYVVHLRTCLCLRTLDLLVCYTLFWVVVLLLLLLFFTTTGGFHVTLLFLDYPKTHDVCAQYKLQEKPAQIVTNLDFDSRESSPLFLRNEVQSHSVRRCHRPCQPLLYYHHHYQISKCIVKQHTSKWMLITIVQTLALTRFNRTQSSILWLL